MPRPRKDGKPAARATRIGVERTSGAGKKWRVRSYAPTDGTLYGRVVYLSQTTGKSTSKVPEDGQTLDTVFDQVERALTQRVAMGTGTDGNGQPDACRRDICALSEMYLDYLRSKGRDDDYIANRKSILRKWILPSIGSVLVAEWCTEHSQGVITKARAGELGGDRVADLGSTLSGMRMTAWRRRPGGRWLSPDENPMEDVEYGRGATRQGAGRNYLPPQKRPATSSVEEAIQTSAQVGRWVWLPFIISIAAFCALRLGEQLGLRAVDVDLRGRLLDVNGAWSMTPSGHRAGHGKVRVGRRKPNPIVGYPFHCPARRLAGCRREACVTPVRTRSCGRGFPTTMRAWTTSTGCAGPTGWYVRHADGGRSPRRRGGCGGARAILVCPWLL
jgi:hypothetical protein